NLEGGCYGTGSIDADPRFAKPSLGAFSVRFDAPSIDAGTAQKLRALASTDLSGFPRPQRNTFDMGATELPPVFLVDKDAAKGTADGLDWETAFNTIQGGIDAADDEGGGEVWVANGTYSENRIAAGADGALLLRENVGVYGG